MLALKDGYAISRDLDENSEHEFLTYALEHCEEIATRTRIKMESLFFITGTTMTGDWDAVAIESNTRRLSLGTEISPLARTSIAFKRSSGQVVHDSSGHHHPTANTERPPETEVQCCSQPKNQCIFVRAWFIRDRRRWRGPKVMKAGAGPKHYRKNRDSDEAGCSVMIDSDEEMSETEQSSEVCSLLHKSELICFTSV